MGDHRECRGIGPHPFRIVPPIVVVPGGKRVVLHCPRCLTWRVEVWSARGEISKRRYEKPEEYQAYIRDHTRAEARLDLLTGMEVVRDATNHPHLRLVRGGKGQVKKAALRRRRA